MIGLILKFVLGPAKLGLGFLATHWLTLISAKLIIAAVVAVAVAAAGWIYHKGAAHERAHEAKVAAKIEAGEIRTREEIDETILDSVRNGTVADRLRNYYRD